MRLVRRFTEVHKGRLYVVEPVAFVATMRINHIRTQDDMDAHIARGGVYVRVACIGSAK